MKKVKIDVTDNFSFELITVNHRLKGFGSETQFAIIAFVLGAIGSGFFNEIGKNIWGLFKEKAKSILKNRIRQSSKHTVIFLATFELKEIYFLLLK